MLGFLLKYQATLSEGLIYNFKYYDKLFKVEGLYDFKRLLKLSKIIKNIFSTDSFDIKQRLEPSSQKILGFPLLRRNLRNFELILQSLNIFRIQAYRNAKYFLNLESEVMRTRMLNGFSSFFAKNQVKRLRITATCMRNIIISNNGICFQSKLQRSIIRLCRLATLTEIELVYHDSIGLYHSLICKIIKENFVENGYQNEKVITFNMLKDNRNETLISGRISDKIIMKYKFESSIYPDITSIEKEGKLFYKLNILENEVLEEFESIEVLRIGECNPRTIKISFDLNIISLTELALNIKFSLTSQDFLANFNLLLLTNLKTLSLFCSEMVSFSLLKILGKCPPVSKLILKTYFAKQPVLLKIEDVLSHLEGFNCQNLAALDLEMSAKQIQIQELERYKPILQKIYFFRLVPFCNSLIGYENLFTIFPKGCSFLLERLSLSQQELETFFKLSTIITPKTFKVHLFFDGLNSNIKLIQGIGKFIEKAKSIENFLITVTERMNVLHIMDSKILMQSFHHSEIKYFKIVYNGLSYIEFRKAHNGSKILKEERVKNTKSKQEGCMIF